MSDQTTTFSVPTLPETDLVDLEAYKQNLHLQYVVSPIFKEAIDTLTSNDTIETDKLKRLLWSLRSPLNDLLKRKDEPEVEIFLEKLKELVKCRIKEVPDEVLYILLPMYLKLPLTCIDELPFLLCSALVGLKSQDRGINHLAVGVISEVIMVGEIREKMNERILNSLEDGLKKLGIGLENNDHLLREVVSALLSLGGSSFTSLKLYIIQNNKLDLLKKIHKLTCESYPQEHVDLPVKRALNIVKRNIHMFTTLAPYQTLKKDYAIDLEGMSLEVKNLLLLFIEELVIKNNPSSVEITENIRNHIEPLLSQACKIEDLVTKQRLERVKTILLQIVDIISRVELAYLKVRSEMHEYIKSNRRDTFRRKFFENAIDGDVLAKIWTDVEPYMIRLLDANNRFSGPNLRVINEIDSEIACAAETEQRDRLCRIKQILVVMADVINNHKPAIRPVAEPKPIMKKEPLAVSVEA